MQYILICLGQDYLENKLKISTLESVIKQEIRKRIYIALALILLIPLISLIYAYYSAITMVKSEIDSEIAQLSDTVMGQYLVDNVEAINLNIVSFNKSHKAYQVMWLRLPQNKFDAPTFHWGVINFIAKYPIRSDIGGQNMSAGQLVITGKLSLLIFQKLLSIIILCVIICIFTLVLYLLLIPLANDIPSRLIMEPIQVLIKLMHKDGGATNGEAIGSSHYEEFRQIEHQIRQLILTVKQQENDLAFIAVSRKVIHNIKSPLRTALSCNQRLYKNSGLTNSLVRKINRSLQNMRNQLSHLHSDIRKQERADKENSQLLSSVLFKSYIQEIITDKMIEHNQRVDILIDANELNDESWCYVAPYTFTTHISNLLNNAYEAVAHKLHSATIKVKLSENKANSQLVCEIWDNGCGMCDELLGKAIAGYTTKSSGSGIGLSSAKIYFMGLGGDITINSDVNIGTLVRVEMLKSDAPTWFIKDIIFSDYVVILDDDQEVHALLQTMFRGVSEVRYFTKVEQFKQWYSNNSDNIKDVTYFIDNHIEYRDKLGVDLIENYKINSQAYLMTDDYDDGELQQKAINLNIKMIPKQLLKTIFKNNLCDE